MTTTQKPTAEELPIRFRVPQDSDIGFITKTWLRENKKFHSKAYPGRLYYPDMQKVIMQLARCSQCLIACPPDDIGFIYGFVCGKPLSESVTLLHYLYVKPTWQQLGIGQRLVEALGHRGHNEVVATHWSWKLDLSRVPGNVIHNPSILFGIIRL